jgi:predicted small metal-binding protein
MSAGKRWTCVEAGCDFEHVAPDVASAVEHAQRHIAEAHGSFELDEMIEDVLEDVPEDVPEKTPTRVSEEHGLGNP